MKKMIKSFVLVSLLVMGLSSASNAACVPYSIQCDNGSFSGTVCGDTTEEIVGKAWAIAEIVC